MIYHSKWVKRGLHFARFGLHKRQSAYSARFWLGEEAMRLKEIFRQASPQ